MALPSFETASDSQVAPEPPEPADSTPGVASPPETIEEPAASSSLIRAAYVLIFLLSVLVSFTIWPQVGGQAHLDVMPFYWKLLLPLAFSFTIVRASIAAGRQPDAWNRKAVLWLISALFFAGIIAGLTYYYHLQESKEPLDSDDGVITSVAVRSDRTRA